MAPAFPVQKKEKYKKTTTSKTNPEQIEGNEINERPQRERRPPDWFVDYQMSF